jgi:hypothetical protein
MALGTQAGMRMKSSSSQDVCLTGAHHSCRVLLSEHPGTCLCDCALVGRVFQSVSHCMAASAAAAAAAAAAMCDLHG